MSTIHELVRAQVLRDPQRIAVRRGAEAVSYEELWRRAETVARSLVDRGVRPGDFVGVLAGRTIGMVTAILGVLEAGACYVPLDPALPEGRRRFIMDDAGVRVVVTGEESGGGSGELPAVAPDALCYVMYTSGSTGQPKGVMIEHRAVVHLAKDPDYVSIDPADRILLTGAIGFDLNTFEIWGALLNGATLVLPDDDDALLDAERVQAMMERHGVTIIGMTTALCSRLIAQDPAVFRSARAVLVGGDVVLPETCRLIRAFSPDVRVINVYGPTECTTFTTTFSVDAEFMVSVPIGTPLRNVTVHVVDETGAVLGDEVPGELLIGGAGLARGYLNRPELTRERFLDHPQLGRVYRSGDIVRRRADGNLEFLGRKDRQVKIGGYRIELREVEALIAAVPGVLGCVVRVWENRGEKFLAAYYAGGRQAPEAEGLRRHLLASAPEFLVPAFLTRMKSFPLDAHGKVDQHALPNPFAVPATAAPPTIGALQERIREAWQKTLGIARVDLDADFYELGGSSIKAVHLMGLLTAQGIRVALADILHYRTVAALTSYLQDASMTVPEPAAGTTPGPLRDASQLDLDALRRRVADDLRHNDAAVREGRLLRTYPFSPMQELQFAYVTPPSRGSFRIDAPLDLDLLARAYEHLVAGQGLLRSIAVRSGGGWTWQEREPARPPRPSILDLSDTRLSDAELSRIPAAIAPAISFDHDGLLHHVVVVKRSAREHYVLLVFHHILFDRVSMEVIERELLAHYRDLAAGRAIAPRQTNAFADYVRRMVEGPQGITRDELIDVFRLRDFHRAKQALLASPRLRPSAHSSWFQIAAPAPGHLERGQSLGTALSLYAKGVGAVFGVDRAPILFVHEGRRQGRHAYYDVVGEHIDFVPMVIDADATAEETQREVDARLEALTRCSINFAYLFGRRVEGWEEIERLIDPGPANSRLDVCMFNYLGNQPEPGSVTDHDDRAVEQTENPLPIQTLLNCIAVTLRDGFVFRIRSTYESHVDELRQAFEDGAGVLRPLRGSG